MSEEPTTEAAAAPKPKKNKLVIILIATNVLIAGGFGAYVALAGGGGAQANAEGAEGGEHGAPPAAEGGEAADPAAVDEHANALGTTFGPIVEVPEIITNLNGEDGYYIKLKLSIEAPTELAKEKITAALVPLRAAVLRHLRRQTARDLLGASNEFAQREVEPEAEHGEEGEEHEEEELAEEEGEEEERPSLRQRRASRRSPLDDLGADLEELISDDVLPAGIVKHVYITDFIIQGT